MPDRSSRPAQHAQDAATRKLLAEALRDSASLDTSIPQATNKEVNWGWKLLVLAVILALLSAFPAPTSERINVFLFLAGDLTSLAALIRLVFVPKFRGKSNSSAD